MTLNTGNMNHVSYAWPVATRHIVYLSCLHTWNSWVFSVGANMATCPLSFTYASPCRHLLSVLNAAARSVAGRRRSDHITETLSVSLHWSLYVSERIQFKLVILIFRSLRGLAPQFTQQASRPRSSQTHWLEVPTVRLMTIGDRTFHAADSRVLWNSLYRPTSCISDCWLCFADGWSISSLVYLT